MSLLLETLKVKNNIFCNTGYHNQRMNRSRKALFGVSDFIKLEDEILLQHLDKNKIFKCRVIYDTKIQNIEFAEYKIPVVTSLKLVEDNFFDYTFKFTDRTHLEMLRSLNSEADDVLIIKNGYITDSSFANVIFWDGSNWVTSDTPLLRGTKRQYYIETKKIFEREIKPTDLRSFEKARIINAMIDIEDSADIYTFQ